MAFDIATIESGNAIVLNKKGKMGSFARAIAFADRDTRIGMGQALYAKWLETGNFRPVADDIVNTLVAKSARPYLAGYVTPTGQVSRAGLMSLCVAVCNAVVQSGKEPKGEKSFVYEIARRIASEAAPTIIEA